MAEERGAGHAGTVRRLTAPVHGAVVGIEVEAGQQVAAGQVLLVQEAMKMEVPLEAPAAGRVRAIAVAVGEVAAEGALLVEFEPGGAAPSAAPAAPAPSASPEALRADLQALHARRALLADAARPEAVARRHAAGRRTARENVAALLDEGSFSEYGAFAVAAQRGRREMQDLIERTPADGIIGGTARINADLFGDSSACARWTTCSATPRPTGSSPAPARSPGARWR